MTGKAAGAVASAERIARQALEFRATPAAIALAGESGPRAADMIVHTDHADISIRQSSGSKLPVLLIHGNSSCKEVFSRQFESFLGQEYRLIAIDLPGHGASSDAFDPQRTYSIRGYADTAIQVLEKLGIDDVVVLGWSLGGHVGLEMIAMYPDLLGLMITGTPPVAPDPASLAEGFHPHPHLALGHRQDLTAEEIANFTLIAAGGIDDPVLRAAVARTDGRARALMAASLYPGNVTDERQLVETSPIPVAIVNGADDPLINNDYICGLTYANLWDRKCHLMAGIGHAPFLEAAEVFNHVALRFLRDMERVAHERSLNPVLCYSA